MNETLELDVWTTALNLPEYEVVHYAESDGVRHLSVVPRFLVEICPDCGQPCQRLHQKRWIQNVVDLPLGDLPVRLKVRVFQYHCESCDRIWTPKSLLFTPDMGAKATARFVERAAEFIRRADISGAAAFFQVPRKTLERWYYQWVEIQDKLAEEEAATDPFVGNRRTCLKKKHRQFVCVIVDHTNQRVLDILESREKSQVKAYFQEGLDSGLFAEVEEVTSDMWEAYGNAAREVFGESVRVTIDRFHVMQHFQEQLTKARREIQRDLPDEARTALKGTRWLWLKNANSLTVDEQETLERLSKEYPRLGRLRAQRERLRTIFEDVKIKTSSQGKRHLQAWLSQARGFGLQALNRFCDTLENWLEPIANYFVSRSSNGPTEGYNNGFRAVLRRAFGMRNFEHFRARVLHLFGKPKPQESP